MSAPVATFLDGDSPVFAVFHATPAGVQPRAPVLFYPPWGWEDVASYRSRWRWAQELAACGHPTLRFDLPGTGDSADAGGGEGLLGSWLEAAEAAAARLREQSGEAAVTAIGLGLGGLLLRQGIADGAAIEDAVLWGAPATGSTFVREVRAFSRLQGTGTRDGSELWEGARGAGGAVLDAATVAELSKLAPADLPAGSLRRALLLDRDGVAVDAAVVEGMTGAGVEVRVEPGTGWAGLVGCPESSKLAEPVAGLVRSWLAEAPVRAERERTVPPPERQAPGTRIGGGISERPWTCRQTFGRCFGIVAEPSQGPEADVVAVFFNAGAVRNTGPNRMWVDTARRWARHGTASLRVDLEAIGDADESEVRLRKVADFYTTAYEGQALALLEAIADDFGRGRRYLLVGLCSGGFLAFRTALSDPRVAGVVALNAGALRWYPEILTDRETPKAGRALEGAAWRKLLCGRYSARSVLTLLHSLVRSFGAKLLRPLAQLGLAPASPADRLTADLDRFREAGAEMTLGFSAGEPLEQELRSLGVLDRLASWPNIRVQHLPGDNHTLTPPAAQAAAAQLLDAELERALG